MITRPILEAQRKLYLQGREKAIADVNAFNGAIKAIDDLLDLCAQKEQAAADERQADADEKEAGSA